MDAEDERLDAVKEINWEVLCRFFPEGWREQARALGALRRARRVGEAETLLRILLIHLANGCSLAETALRARQAGLAQMSSVAVFKRLKAAEAWLRWLAVEQRGVVKLPGSFSSRRLRAVDATAVSEPGSTGSDWRIHYSVDLADLQCDFFELTDVHGGESWRRFPVEPGDVLLGDRGYANPNGIEHVVRHGGGLIVRLNVGSLPLYQSDGNRLKVLQWASGLPATAPRDCRAVVRGPSGEPIEGRLIGIRRSEMAAEKARRRARRDAERKGRMVSAESLEAARYFLLWSVMDFPCPAAEVLEAYRLRWQIELVFKRFKSILGLGHLPKQDPASARAWLYGKMFVGMLTESIMHAADSLSPWGYALERTP